MLDPGVGGTRVDSALCVEEVCKGRCRGESDFKPSCFIRASDDRLKGFSADGDGMLEISCEGCFGDSRFGSNNEHRVVGGAVPIVISRRGGGVKVITSHALFSKALYNLSLSMTTYIPPCS